MVAKFLSFVVIVVFIVIIIIIIIIKGCGGILFDSQDMACGFNNNNKQFLSKSTTDDGQYSAVTTHCFL